MLSSPRRVFACIAVALALTGCSDASTSDAGPGDASASGTAEARTAPDDGPVLGTTPEEKAPTFIGVQHELPTGAALRNVPDLYERVAMTGCAATADGWRAEGTAENTGTAPQRFRVLVLFTDAQARAVDSASTAVSVPAGSTATWTATREFETTPGMQCVVRAVSGGK